jgi:hypothetical protein
MDARAEREAQITAGELQASHRVSAATPNRLGSVEEIGTAIGTVLSEILVEMRRLNVTLERLADKE